MTTTVLDSRTDVVAPSKAQHRQIERLMDEVTASVGSERRSVFTTLRRMLAMHETAEELEQLRDADQLHGMRAAVAADQLVETIAPTRPGE